MISEGNSRTSQVKGEHGYYVAFSYATCKEATYMSFRAFWLSFDPICWCGSQVSDRSYALSL